MTVILTMIVILMVQCMCTSPYTCTSARVFCELEVHDCTFEVIPSNLPIKSSIQPGTLQYM